VGWKRILTGAAWLAASSQASAVVYADISGVVAPGQNTFVSYDLPVNTILWLSFTYEGLGTSRRRIDLVPQYAYLEYGPGGDLLYAYQDFGFARAVGGPSRITGNTLSFTFGNFDDAPYSCGVSGGTCVFRAARMGLLADWDNDVDRPLRYRLLIASVPEPSAWALMILGFGGIAIAARRKRNEPRAHAIG
jgi:hypothetical protein